MKRAKIHSLLVPIILTSSLLCACHKSGSAPATATQPSSESSAPAGAQPVTSPNTVAPPVASPGSASPAAVPSGPPSDSDVNEAVARVFQQAAAPDRSTKPDCVVGDFNGDGSEDLAVLVKPNEAALSDINNEVANWTLEDPMTIAPLRPDLSLSPAGGPPPPVRADKNDMLLAVIHGVGPQGWRNPQARQTYLLKNNSAGQLAMESFKSLRNRAVKDKLPGVRGDAIVETVDGRSGLLIWTGAKYAWFAPGQIR